MEGAIVFLVILGLGLFIWILVKVSDASYAHGRQDRMNDIVEKSVKRLNNSRQSSPSSSVQSPVSSRTTIPNPSPSPDPFSSMSAYDKSVLENLVFCNTPRMRLFYLWYETQYRALFDALEGFSERDTLRNEIVAFMNFFYVSLSEEALGMTHNQLAAVFCAVGWDLFGDAYDDIGHVVEARFDLYYSCLVHNIDPAMHWAFFPLDSSYSSVAFRLVSLLCDIIWSPATWIDGGILYFRRPESKQLFHENFFKALSAIQNNFDDFKSLKEE